MTPDGPRDYLIVTEGDAGTNYSAYAPDLPGCAATGSTVVECERNMRSAIVAHLEVMREHGDAIPAPTIAAAAFVPAA